jgi:hypothetical protein
MSRVDTPKCPFVPALSTNPWTTFPWGYSSMEWYRGEYAIQRPKTFYCPKFNLIQCICDTLTNIGLKKVVDVLMSAKDESINISFLTCSAEVSFNDIFNYWYSFAIFSGFLVPSGDEQILMSNSLLRATI